MPEQLKIFSVECLLSLVTSVTHEFSEEGNNKITTRVTLGGQVSECTADVKVTGDDRRSLMDDNTDIALNAAIEAIEGGAQVFVDGKLLVLASDEEQEEFRIQKNAELVNREIPSHLQ